MPLEISLLPQSSTKPKILGRDLTINKPYIGFSLGSVNSIWINVGGGTLLNIYEHHTIITYKLSEYATCAFTPLNETVTLKFTP